MRPTSNVQKLAKLEALAASEGRDMELLAALSDPDALVRQRAIVLSARFLEPSTLVSVLRDGSEAARRSAAFTALKRQVPYCFDELRRACHDPDPDVTIWAMEILSCARDPQVFPLLESMVESGDENVAAAALEAMGRLGDRRACSFLVRALERGPWQRMAAIAALGELGDRAATQVLVSALLDPEVRDLAVCALGKLGDRAAIVPLARLAEQATRPSTFHKILVALGALVEEAKPLDTNSQIALHSLCASVRVAEVLGLVKNGEAKLARVATRLILAVGAGEVIIQHLLARAAREPNEWREMLPHARNTVENALPLLLAHTNPEVRIEALQVAERIDGSVEVVLRAAEHADPRIRAAACALLGRAARYETAQILVMRLCRGVDAEQEAARAALTAFGEKALPALSEALLRNHDPGARVKLLEALATVAVDELGPLAPHVFAWAKSGPIAQRKAAIATCGALVGKEARSVLHESLDDTECALSGEAARHLARLGDIEPLIVRLSREHAARFRWIASLGLAGDARAVRPLLALFDHALAHERIIIAGALGRIADWDAVRFLESKVSDAEVTIRRVAAETLCTNNAQLGLPVLRALARDEDWVVRKWAVKGLLAHQAEGARELLVELARDTDDMVSDAARAALGHAEGELLMNGSASEVESRLIEQLLDNRYGWAFDDIRRPVLEARLRERREQLGLLGAMDYYHYLRFHPGREDETDTLKHAVTNNETYFFRAQYQLSILSDFIVPNLAPRLNRPLRVLSAGCSSGEEAYSLGIQLARVAGRLPQGYEVYGFDLNALRIEQGQRAIYGESSLRACDDAQRLEYFNLKGDNTYELKPGFRRGVKLAQGNLMTGLPWLHCQFDVVYCRNVLLYLSPAGVDRALNAIARCLRPEGFLFVGHAESLLGRQGQFDPDTLANTVVYRRSADS